jgi:acetyl esterase/lipase
VYCSIRSARANAGDLNVDPGRIALRGGSAGATLDNMVALGGDGAPFDGGCFAASQSARVQAVIDYFGAADFNRPINAEGEPPGAQPFLGPNPSQATIDEASPINYVSPDDPPYVIGHGTADRTVLISQSIELANALNDDGVPADLVRVKGAPHGFIDSFNGAFSRSVRCDEEGLLADTLQPGS